MLPIKIYSKSNIARILCAVGVFFAALPTQASHIVGGQIEMRAVHDKSGHFSVAVTYYFDEDQTFLPLSDGPLSIYRKRDNQYMGYVQVYNQNIENRPLLPFANQPCGNQRPLRISVVRYTGDLQLNPSDYTDPQGYYITYQICCRNGGISNIQNPVNAGYVFYLEFPPLLKAGKPFVNSSPIFDPIDSEYICVNDPFTFDFDAKDPDGDELRYQLVTPLQGFQEFGNQQILPGPYPPVRWAAGYSSAQSIPGNPSLQIDPLSGQLSVTADRLGLYIFTVQVDEYRRGERIGSVRRDYQFMVIDCPPSIPPDPTITVDGTPAASLTICEGRSLLLEATVNNGWNYQWKKDGRSIPGATTPSLRVSTAGTYQLTTTLINQCSRTRRARQVAITVRTASFRLQPDSLPPLCRTEEPIRLQAISGVNYRYDWYQDGRLVSANGPANWNAKQPGLYWVAVRDTVQGCQFRSDTAQVRTGFTPNLAITSVTGQTAICTNDSLPLRVPDQPHYHYQWQKDSQSLPGAITATWVAHQAGNYTVAVRDTSGCQALTPPFSITVLPRLTATLDSIPPVCDSLVAKPIRLKGEPAGGSYSGAGVQNGLFDANVAGPGNHPIQYTVTGQITCQWAGATRLAVVRNRPMLKIGLSPAIWQGTSVQLPVSVSPNLIYRWSPPQSLDNPHQAQPIAQPSETTTYTLTVQDPSGCSTSDTIQVRVFERIWIPDAFSPNGDGLNDTWELRGIAAYPDAELTIFDRWGEVVFHSMGYVTPFDGTLAKQPLPGGLYPYRLKAGGGSILVSGTVTLIR